MQVRLVSYKDGKPDLTFFLDAAGTSIGRDAGNLVQLVSPDVSKRHARIQQVAKGWCVQDLESKNGVFVNGQRVKEALLKEGDAVAFGPFKFTFESAPPNSQYKPVHVIEMGTKADDKTMINVKKA